MVTISLIIPTFNNVSTLKACLESIQRQTVQPTEIIIADGHSTDGTINIAKEFNCKIVYENKGTRAAACNIALDVVEGEVTVFTDSDVIVKENWLENIVDSFSKLEDENVVCVTGPNVEYPNESLFGKAVNAIYNTFLGGGWSEQVKGIFKKDRRFVHSAAGCNAAYKTEILKEVLPFNENLLTAEDTDINYRLIQKGYQIYFEPEVIVFHQRPQNLKSFKSKSRKYAMGKIQFFREHKNGLEVWHLLPTLYFLSGLFFSLALFVNPWLVIGLATYLGIYIVIIILASIVQTIKFKQWKFFFMLPIMFVVGHVSWNNGILQEIFSPMKMRSEK